MLDAEQTKLEYKLSNPAIPEEERAELRKQWSHVLARKVALGLKDAQDARRKEFIRETAMRIMANACTMPDMEKMEFPFKAAASVEAATALADELERRGL